jgi:hypothetical protein
LDTEICPYWDGDFDIPNGSPDHYKADTKYNRELDKDSNDPKSPERLDVIAALNGA